MSSAMLGQGLAKLGQGLATTRPRPGHDKAIFFSSSKLYQFFFPDPNPFLKNIGEGFTPKSIFYIFL
jgi:hypothetical protein